MIFCLVFLTDKEVSAEVFHAFFLLVFSLFLHTILIWKVGSFSPAIKSRGVLINEKRSCL